MVKCSICKQDGHNKSKCPSVPREAPAPLNTVQVSDSIAIMLPQEVREKLSRLSGLCGEVAGGLGKGHVEAHYQQALCVELQEAGIRYVAEEVMPIIYKGRPLGGTCNARLDVMLHNFLPFIFELKSVPSRICAIHQWQLVRYMTHKDVPFGAVVNFNQSESGPLEVQFIVKQEGIHWLYDPLRQTGRPLVDFGMSLPVSVNLVTTVSHNGPVSASVDSLTTETEDEWSWSEDE